MKCVHIAALASAYVDLQLSGPDRCRVQLHLLVCKRCRRLITHLRLLLASLRAHEQPVEGRVAQSILERIQAVHWGRDRGRP